MTIRFDSKLYFSNDNMRTLQNAINRLPMDMRDKPIKSAVQKVVREISAEQASILKAKPKRPLNNRQQDRPRLQDQMGQRLRNYGYTIYGIAGPKRMWPFLGHAYPIDRGFRIVHGGTIERERGKIYADGKRRINQTRGRNRNKDLEGKGVSSRRVPAYPYVKPAFDKYASKMQQYLMVAVSNQLRKALKLSDVELKARQWGPVELSGAYLRQSMTDYRASVRAMLRG